MKSPQFPLHHILWVSMILISIVICKIYLKELSDETGYSSIWINQDIPNSNWLISSIKLRLHDQCKQGWYSLIEHSPKTLNYRIFKENFEFENYCRILIPLRLDRDHHNHSQRVSLPPPTPGYQCFVTGMVYQIYLSLKFTIPK
jgi:hypothetical protein